MSKLLNYVFLLVKSIFGYRRKVRPTVKLLRYDIKIVGMDEINRVFDNIEQSCLNLESKLTQKNRIPECHNCGTVHQEKPE